MQLVHQGVDFIPVDFIAIKTTPHHLNLEHHVQLLANMSAQAKALAFGQTLAEANNDPFRVFDGNRPSSTFLLNDLTPQSLGFLIALYEHKIFVQGIFWNLNSYDQPGVELGKILAKAEMVLS
jgi:glucose-6-phosphate isomerase